MPKRSPLSESYWHAGRWLASRPIVKIDWTAPDGSALSSGFGFATP